VQFAATGKTKGIDCEAEASTAMTQNTLQGALAGPEIIKLELWGALQVIVNKRVSLAIQSDQMPDRVFGR
jgi:hypothetical protein